MSDNDSEIPSLSSNEYESDISGFSSELSDTDRLSDEYNDQDVGQEDDGFMEMDDFDIDLDGDDIDNQFLRQILDRFRFRNVVEEDSDSVSLEERPLESDIRNDYNQHFDYLTQMIRSEESSTVNDFSSSTLSLPTFGTHKACIIPLREIIPLPGDQIPYVTSNPSMVILLLQLLGIHEHSEESRLVPCLAGIHINSADEETEIRYGCTVTIQKAYFNERLFSIGVVFTCKNRCEITSFSLSSTRVIIGNIQILEDPTETPPFDYPSLPTKPSSLYLLPVIGKTALIPHLADRSEAALQQACISILRAYNDHFNSLSDTEILRQVSSNTPELSYFLCNQMLINYEEEKQLFLCDSAEDRIQLAGRLCRTTTVIRCKCKNRLHRFVSSQRLNLFGGNCNKSVFVNRYGNSFRVITTRSLMNYVEVTRPSGEDTWFPGYQWQILECSRCMNHIGWKFVAESDVGLQEFFAISQSSIIFSETSCVCLQTN